MSMPQDEEHSEESPLLHEPIADNGTIERGDVSEEESADKSPLIAEYSTSRSILTLGSIWVGVFLAAAGLAPNITELRRVLF
jgi:hypothetical protein